MAIYYIEMYPSKEIVKWDDGELSITQKEHSEATSLTEFVDKLIVNENKDYSHECVREIQRINTFIKEHRLTQHNSKRFKVNEREIPSKLELHLGMTERALFARMLTSYGIPVDVAGDTFSNILKAGLKTEYNQRFPENKTYDQQPTLKFNNAIRCPYCDKDQIDTLDDLVEIGDMADTFKHECENCDRTFTVTFEYRPYNHTSK